MERPPVRFITLLLVALISVAAVQAQSEDSPHSGRHSSKAVAGSTIAYVRKSMEIRTISPDGSGDRRLWTHPDLKIGRAHV